jgi:iron complex outermembrane receptor protein
MRYGAYKANLAGFMSTSKNGVTFDSVTNQISQQREVIYGVEFNGEAAINERVTVGTSLTYREGRFDSNKDGSIDRYLPNNRIATPFRATANATYRFDNDVAVRVEGEAFTGRNKAINLTGTRYEIKPGALMNLGLDAPFKGGRAYLAVNNVFDTQYENPTATSVRNLPVYSWGRTVTFGYRRTY